MVQYKIHGGNPLYGSIPISGAKNAAVAILPAALLVDGVCRIENIPRINDVTLMLEIMHELGAKVILKDDTTLEIDTRQVRSVAPSYANTRVIRASYYIIGALLSRFHHAQVSMPGGCDFGTRPIDLHIKGFKALGAQVEIRGGFIHADCEDRLSGNLVYLDMPSVGATINIMLAAVLADGATVIENAAREPHIVDLANFLNCMGADIRGAGTDVIKIRGVHRLTGGSYAIIPDQIEAGTYMLAVAATGGEVRMENVIPKHLECVSAKLLEMGCEVFEGDDSVTVRRITPLQPVNVITKPYPGFPTDMQPQMVAALSLVESGTSTMAEQVWNSRYRYVDELRRLGANIMITGQIAVIEGVPQLTGAPVSACDLRAGAALVIAGLAAQNTTVIENVQYIERGYADLVEKLRTVGADIERVEVADKADQLAALS